MQASGTPRNLGAPVVSALVSRMGNRTTKPKTKEGGFPSPGSEERAQTRYGQAKAAKCGRMGDSVGRSVGHATPRSRHEEFADAVPEARGIWRSRSRTLTPCRFFN